MNEMYVMTAMAILNGHDMDPVYEGEVQKIGALICMMIEEYCRRHDMDAPEFAQDVADVVKQVNSELERYGHEN